MNHECREYLHRREAAWTEPHGERCSAEWWQCAVCRAEYTERELEAICGK